MPDSEIVEVDGIRVTDLRRTALDLAQTGTFAQALTVVDGVLARGVSKESLHAAAAERTTTGIRIAQRAVAHGSGLSATVGESWSRAQMIDADLPLPQLQREYWLSGEQYFPDYDWDGLLIGEFDGLIKYRGVLREGEKPHDAVAETQNRASLRIRAPCRVRTSEVTRDSGQNVRRGAGRSASRRGLRRARPGTRWPRGRRAGVP
ncbi:hypothetical protein MUG78_15720 [Gordonia alkaliphila]|uniref:hypothetical protein n=1 Tax=Gordonia alkaliphila TaxID=1053547 RepID=UPI001FF32425|nr:hypothetical protein [Gordonia alkaliphila]MCK0440858.1 hypothetical protein [Gordonia alkaliphila]